MLNKFNNLPGVYVTKEDGNLRILETIPSNVTLILGTAPDGPAGQIYLVTDSITAERIFDPAGTKTGTLLRGMYEALEKGAQYVALYRVGATPAAVDFVNGYTIITDQANNTVGNNYRLYYTNVSNEILRVYTTEGTLVYENIDGMITRDLGKVIVAKNYQGKSNVTIGSNVDIQQCPLFSAFNGPNNYNAGTVSPYAAVPSASSHLHTTEQLPAGIIVSTDATGTPYFLVEYSFSAVNSGTTYFKNKVKKLKVVNGEFAIDGAWNGSFDSFTTVRLKPTYIPAENGLDLTLNQKYLAYARAYWELEGANVDIVVPQDIYLDENNVVDNEGELISDPEAVFGDADFLSKGYEFVANGQIFYAFSTDDTTADELPSAYELGINGFSAKAWSTGQYKFETAVLITTENDLSKPADIVFHELNFGHQLASYLHGLSENQTEASGVIAMKPPVNFSKMAIARWLGDAPVYDSNGTIIKSGSGLLGYKFMAGSVDVAPGFFATNTGFVDGTPLSDPQGNLIDIGRYIDVVATPLIIRNAYDNTLTGYLSPGVCAYAGTLISLEPNQAPTNKKLKGNARLPFPLHKQYLDALVGTRYIVFTEGVDGVVKIVDGPTAALPTSDWRRRMTCRIVGAIVDWVRQVADPFIGGITKANIRQNLEDMINSGLVTFQEQDWLEAGMAEIRQSQAMMIQGTAALRLRLNVVGELRQINVYVALMK